MINETIQIELQLDPNWNHVTERRFWENANVNDLRYDVLLGDIIIKINGIDFSAQWGWIPLLDIAYCLRLMSEEILVCNTESSFDFTESDDWIKLRNRGTEVEISTSYVPETTHVDLQKLYTEMIKCARGFFLRVSLEQPGLSSNMAFQRMYKKVFMDGQI